MRFLLSLALLFGVPAASATQSSPAVAINAQEQALVDRAARRGALIYAYDQAAWHGTDDALATAPDLGPKSGGWVVDGPPDATELVFFDRDVVTPHALYTARFRDNKLVYGHVLGADDDRQISPSRLKLIAALHSARSAAQKAEIGNCSDRPFNTVVLPPEMPGGPTLVYFLTPQTTSETVPLGGHYLVEVAANGAAGVPTPFAKSCIQIPIPTKTANVLVVSHIVSPLPNEIHVFTSLSLNLPLLVATAQNRLLWPITGRKIGTPEPIEDTPPATARAS